MKKRLFVIQMCLVGFNLYYLSYNFVTKEYNWYRNTCLILTALLIVTLILQNKYRSK